MAERFEASYPTTCVGARISEDAQPPFSPEDATPITMTVVSSDGQVLRRPGCTFLENGKCTAQLPASQAPDCFQYDTAPFQVKQNTDFATLVVENVPETKNEKLILLGNLLEARRKGLGLSLRAVAEPVNVSAAYLSMLENGKNPKTEKPSQPSVPVLVRLCNVLQVNILLPLKLAGYDVLADVIQKNPNALILS